MSVLLQTCRSTINILTVTQLSCLAGVSSIPLAPFASCRGRCVFRFPGFPYLRSEQDRDIVLLIVRVYAMYGQSRWIIWLFAAVAIANITVGLVSPLPRIPFIGRYSIPGSGQCFRQFLLHTGPNSEPILWAAMAR